MKHQHKALVTTLLLIASTLAATGQKISVGLFRGSELRTVVISVEEGGYTLAAGDSTTTLSTGDLLFATAVGGRVSLWTARQHLGAHHKASVAAKEPGAAALKIEPAFPQQAARRYYGDLQLTADTAGRLSLVNRVGLEKYLAGVVEAESGVGAAPEFYKAQAIICRTYALNHIDRHKDESFHLCDEVHCQVYKGMGRRDTVITAAVEQTHGQVITDQGGMLITAAFHANSGGHTVNSEDVWSQTVPYLRGKPDPHYENQRNSAWQAEFPIAQWAEFLAKNSVPYSRGKKFSFTQRTRQRFMLVDKQPILLTDVRNFFKLRSTFFSVEADGEKVRFSGRGYGHGVGLSQQSAMSMAKKGKSHLEIIRFFYTGVNVIDMNQTTYLQSLLPAE